MRTFLILAIICTVLVAFAMAGNENLQSSLRGEVENKIREKRQFYGGRGGYGGGGFGGGGFGGGGFGGGGYGGRGFGGRGFGGFGGGYGGFGRGGFGHG